MPWDEKGRFAWLTGGGKLYSYLREPYRSELERRLGAGPVGFTVHRPAADASASSPSPAPPPRRRRGGARPD